jgi:hypothetical protein
MLPECLLHQKFKSMLRILTIAFFTTFTIISLSAQYSRARIYLENKNIGQLLNAGICIDHGLHKKDFIENDFAATELELARSLGFRTEILISDVTTYYAAQNNPEESKSAASCVNPLFQAVEQIQAPQNFRLGSMGGYYTYQEFLNELDSMRAKYPNLISQRQVINPNDLTNEGRPIYWIRISDNPDVDENEPEALFNAVHHAREPMSMSQLIFFMWHLLENYGSNNNISTLLNGTELYFVPCINPDGYIFNQTNNPNGGGMWRKNRRINGDGTFGVDLNRNYGYNWGFDNQGSSPNGSSDTYRGTSAFSEPETRNMRDFALAHDFKVCFNYHSYGNLLIYPWAYSGLQTSDSIYYSNTGSMLSRFNGFLTGTGAETVGYSSNGDADDWQYGEQLLKNKTMTLTPEVGPGDLGFWPPSNQIIPICKSTLFQNLNQAYLLLNFGLAYDRNAGVFSQNNNQIKFDLTKYGFANGNLTVGILALGSEIASLGNTKTFTLNQFQTVSDSISLMLNSGLQNGTPIRFILYVDNGAGLVINDTITKTYGSYGSLFADNNTNLNNWLNIGSGSNWQLTTSDFYSAPSSITDSPNSDYNNSSNSELLLRNPIDLRGASDAVLNFWAKWDIETDYDYLQVFAIGSDGARIALCGSYTNAGTVYQAENEPLFDGRQTQWVNENMSLNDFLGDSSVSILLVLRADQWVRADGFYFDDVNVSVLGASSPSGSIARRNYSLLEQNRPNPASEMVFIPFSNTTFNDKIYHLQVFDALGNLMYQKSISDGVQGVNIETADWPQGNYFYRMIGENSSSETMKMEIRR